MLSNCPECQKVFNPRPGVRICPQCALIEQENYQKVYAYILKRPGSSIEEVAGKTGVPKDSILKLIKQGRIQPGNHVSKLPSCSRCGELLKEASTIGRDGPAARLLCRNCSGHLSTQLRAMGHDPQLHTLRTEAAQPARRYGFGSK